MIRALGGWSGNRLLALTAFVLGALAMFGDPYGGHVVTLDTKELANIVEGEVDHVTAEELADWIIQGRTEYRLVDLREEAAYAEYHIPTAEHVPLAQLPDYALLRNEKIVLYSDGGIHSAQAWFLLKAQRYPGAYMLLGGLDAWKDDVLFPSLPTDAPAAQAAELDKIRSVSRFFGGSPRTGGAEIADNAEVAMPKVDMPTRVVPVTRKRKKKKGC